MSDYNGETKRAGPEGSQRDLQEMYRGTAGFAHRLQAGETLTLFEDRIRQPIDQAGADRRAGGG